MLNHSIVPVGSTGYDIDNSLRFNDDDSAVLTRTLSTAGNLKTWTFSCWFKMGNLVNQQLLTWWDHNAGATNNQHWLGMISGQLEFKLYNGPANTHYGRLLTNQILRDTSAWYHLTAVWDTSNATSGDRMRLYLNGTRVDSFSVETYPALNTDGYVNTTAKNATIGAALSSASLYVDKFDGYLAEVNFVDGQALTPADFGETDETYGHWKPIKYAGTYGTNGFYLDFKTSGNLGDDVSGNTNDWTVNNLVATDQMLDSPTNNFCTLNPISTYPSIVSGTLAGNSLSEGNLKVTTTIASGVAWTPSISSMAVSSGKWYWEYLYVSGYGSLMGVINAFASSKVTTQATTYRSSNGQKLPDGSGSSYGDTVSTGDIVGAALDCDAETIVFYRNGVSQGSVSLGANTKASGTFSPVIYIGDAGVFVTNFGQDSSFAGNKTAQGNADDNGYGDFYYAPPTGFLALCTQNLPEPTVVPSEHFNIVTYTGTGGTQSITGVGFQPDFTWIKARSYARHHWLWNSISGVSRWLQSSNQDLEAYSSAKGITSFDSDGFTYTEDSGQGFNTSSQTEVAWNWKANGAGVSNTDGSIASTVSANVDAGFSIVSWANTGSAVTIGHGLSSTPELIISKMRSASGSWFIHSKSGAATQILRLEGTYAFGTHDVYNNTYPTSSVFSYKHGDAEDFIAYCFHSVEGYSKVGSYTGNGSTDGTFVYTGFRPAYVMIKRTDASGDDWHIVDTTRSAYNVLTHRLKANTSDAESSADTSIDTTSNGFKLRNTSGARNTSGGSYIFLAFAENPFKYTNAR